MIKNRRAAPGHTPDATMLTRLAPCAYRQPDWQDTNVSLFGSDLEKKIKAAAADGEVQWEGQGEKVGVEVWRIEQFKVKAWPRSKYGRFHVGDSYIVLSTYLKDPTTQALAWDVHFWIGSESTADEYGTAAYKAVELDTKLGGEPVQHREVEGRESELFRGYFNRLMYLKGGAASGFTHVEASVRETSLMQVKGRAGNIALKQVDTSRSAMNSGDVFILDCEEAIYQWNGAHAPRERAWSELMERAWSSRARARRPAVQRVRALKGRRVLREPQGGPRWPCRRACAHRRRQRRRGELSCVLEASAGRAQVPGAGGGRYQDKGRREGRERRRRRRLCREPPRGELLGEQAALQARCVGDEGQEEPAQANGAQSALRSRR